MIDDSVRLVSAVVELFGGSAETSGFAATSPGHHLGIFDRVLALAAAIGLFREIRKALAIHLRRPPCARKLGRTRALARRSDIFGRFTGTSDTSTIGVPTGANVDGFVIR